MAGLQAIDTKKGQRVFTNAGASSMGYGVAAAVGAACAKENNEQVFCVGRRLYTNRPARTTDYRS